MLYLDKFILKILGWFTLRNMRCNVMECEHTGHRIPFHEDFLIICSDCEKDLLKKEQERMYHDGFKAGFQRGFGERDEVAVKQITEKFKDGYNKGLKEGKERVNRRY